ncbi:MAG: hypothetical protein ACR2GQ_08460 [Gemmatimonadota bacterium]|jgi:hypothetical protein
MAELIPLVAIFFTIGVPVTALAAHFVLRPLVKDIVQALRGGSRDEVAALQRQIGALQETVDMQEEQLARLVEAESFRKALEAGSR